MIPGVPLAYPVRNNYEEIIEKLNKQKQLIQKLCGNLAEYLSISIDDQLHLIELSKVQTYPKFYTPEHLIEAQDRINAIQDQIDKLEQGLEKLPEEMQLVYNTGLKFPLEQQLNQAKEHLSQIQKDLERENT